MEWSDLILIAFVLLALWTFIPRHLRRALRSGLEPTVIALAGAVRSATRAGWNVFTDGAYRVLIGQPRVMGKLRADEDEGDAVAGTIFEAKRTPESAEIPRSVGEIDPQIFALGETAALARLVAAGKLGLTDAVKIGAGAVSGEKYQKRSREIKAEVERIQHKYPQRTAQQEELRKQLGLSKR